MSTHQITPWHLENWTDADFAAHVPAMKSAVQSITAERDALKQEAANAWTAHGDMFNRLATETGDLRRERDALRAERDALISLAYETRPDPARPDMPPVTWRQAEQNALRKLYAAEADRDRLRAALEKVLVHFVKAGAYPEFVTGQLNDEFIAMADAETLARQALHPSGA